MNSRRVIFARIGYMYYYSGSQKGDEKPKHGGKYNIKGIGHEIYNFKKVDEKLYGYFQPYEPPRDSDTHVKLNLNRIGPVCGDDNKINNVLVIFVARSDDYGQVIIGWYKNAMVYREYQPPRKDMHRESYHYNLTAKINDSVLLPQRYRTYKIPTGSGAFGRTNVFYIYEPNGSDRRVDEGKFSWIKKAIDYVDSYDAPNLLLDATGDAEQDIEDIIESYRVKQTGQGFSVSAELRKAIEDYSISKAEKYFGKDYAVKDVRRLRSYDLECTRNGSLLTVEVKGTQTSGESVILTTNEVRNARLSNSALYILHSIVVAKKKDKYSLSGGKAVVLNPWHIEKQGKLKPLSYMYYISDER